LPSLAFTSPACGLPPSEPEKVCYVVNCAEPVPAALMQKMNAMLNALIVLNAFIISPFGNLFPLL